MITYNLSEVSGPLYESLYHFIKADIIAGKIGVGEKMPSKRTFARNLAVSTITVENAYDQLISEGYLYSVPKKGYFVSDLAGIPKITPKEEVAYDIELPAHDQSVVFDFSSNRTGKENFPFSVWAKLMRETISLKEDKLLEVSPCGGVFELRSAIAAHLSSFRGMAVDPNQIIVGAGTEYLYGMLVKLLGTDKVYCIENPGYMKLLQIYESNGVECRYANLDDKGIVVEELDHVGAQIAHVSPTHHFPTGITMPVNRRYELLAWANEGEGRYIIEDDYDSEFRVNGKPIPTLQSIDGCEKVIYMNTFSKSLTSTIRISYMVLPVHLANLYYKKMSFYSCTVSTFEQYTLAAFISQGYFEKHINRMRLYYGRKRKKMLEIIRNVFDEGECEVIENDSGLHFILKIKTEYSDSMLKDALRKHGIRIRSVADYRIEKASNSHHEYILDYSNVDLEKIKNALMILKEELLKFACS